ncbi:glycoside hydrolase family 3 N-terminal domain-containing protein [Lawsonibacter sp. LCP25S3_G6]|uniref:glycoside hydrolase family 3 N-terminal domain-containing protein n=1 Tax=unclassified Lawsonibacter TaxID=2617946 RepID=UPI003F97052E
MKRLFVFLLALGLLAGCSSAPARFFPYEPAQSAFSLLPVRSKRPPPPEEPQPDPRQEVIDALLSTMTVEEKVGQLFFARCPLNDGAALAQEYHLGGYLLFGRDFKHKTREQVQETIASYQAAASIPMLMGVDEEGGTVARVSTNPNLRAQRFSSPQELYAQGGLEAIVADTAEKDALLQDLGIHVNFAPVADLSTNPEDFIYPRTLGRGAQETANYISAVVSQMESDGMGSVLKHFPGYGPNEDTHTGSALDERPLDQFRAEDFLPFQAGFQAAQKGHTAVLVSHNIMAAVDDTLPASLSPAVHQLLREELGFPGVILTDDLAMAAAAEYGTSAAVLALLAGNDMLVTTDFASEIPQVLSALQEGTLTMQQIDQAAARVLGWKYDLGLLS